MISLTSNNVISTIKANKLLNYISYNGDHDLFAANKLNNISLDKVHDNQTSL